MNLSEIQNPKNAVVKTPKTDTNQGFFEKIDSLLIKGENNTEDNIEEDAILMDRNKINEKKLIIYDYAFKKFKNSEINKNNFNKIYLFLLKKNIKNDLIKDLDLENFVDIVINSNLELLNSVIKQSIGKKLNYVFNNLKSEHSIILVNHMGDGKLSFIINNIKEEKLFNELDKISNFGDFIISLDSYSNLEIKELLENKVLMKLVGEYDIKYIFKYKEKIVKTGKIPWYIRKNK